jgi:hypothetical protein
MILFRNGTSGDGAPYPVTDASWAFGESIIVFVYSMAGISSANLNRAVTISITIVKEITFQRYIAYVFAQMWGACIGASIAKSLRPSGGSALVLSCLVLSCRVISCRVVSCLVLPYLALSCRVLSCLVLTSLDLLCLVLSFFLCLSCLVLS